MRSAGRFLGAACLAQLTLGLIGSAAAEDQETQPSSLQSVPVFGGPSSVGAELRPGDGLTDPIYRSDAIQTGLAPWFSAKEWLAGEYGLAVGVDYQSLFQAATASMGDDMAASGIFRAYASWTLLGRESGNTGTLVAKVENRHGYTDTVPQNLGFAAGAVSITGTMFSDYNGWGLTNLYWQQKLADGRLSFVIGQVDATDYLDMYGLINPLTAFQNLAFSTNPTIASPNQGLGAAAGAYLTNHIYGIVGLADANGDPTNLDLSLFDDFETFKHAELGWVSSRDRAYFDNIHVTVWHQDARSAAGVPEDYGASFSAAWLVDNRWAPFLRAGVSKGTAALYDASISAGVGYLNRHRDLMAIGLNWASPGDDSLDDQFTAEAFYRFQASQNFAATLDGQVIVNPALNPAESAIGVLGVRARVNL
jgi:porin